VRDTKLIERVRYLTQNLVAVPENNDTVSARYCVTDYETELNGFARTGWSLAQNAARSGCVLRADIGDDLCLVWAERKHGFYPVLGIRSGHYVRFVTT
jgi:hypothetical protein